MNLKQTDNSDVTITEGLITGGMGLTTYLRAVDYSERVLGQRNSVVTENNELAPISQHLTYYYDTKAY